MKVENKRTGKRHALAIFGIESAESIATFAAYWPDKLLAGAIGGGCVRSHANPEQTNYRIGLVC